MYLIQTQKMMKKKNYIWKCQLLLINQYIQQNHLLFQTQWSMKIFKKKMKKNNLKKIWFQMAIQKKQMVIMKKMVQK